MTHALRQPLILRAIRGGLWLGAAFVFGQGLRLLSNLILARLLYPEAFGIMAVTMMILTGLQLLSDTGVAQAIARSPRGDDPAFLDTAHTLNILRGALLWGLSALLGGPLAQFYGVPELAALLPVAGLSLLISGFTPTRVETAARHLLMARVTRIELLAQLTGTLAMIALAALSRSVWSLALGAVLTAGAKLVLTHRLLPGRRNRPGRDRRALAELLGFGKWIFLSTACGFLLSQGDKAILGAALSMEAFGLYNIAFLIAAFPLTMAVTVALRLFLPLYREAEQDGALLSRIHRLRRGMVLGTLACLGLLALAGPELIARLYDHRYGAAGPLVTAIAMALMPAVIGLGLDQAALAAGKGRDFFLLLAWRAGVQTAGLTLGVSGGGIGGALLGLALAGIIAHPGIILFARRQLIWRGGDDLAAAGLIALFWAILWPLHHGALAALLP